MIENDDVFDALADGQQRRLLVGLLERDPQRVPVLSDPSREIARAHGAFRREFLSSDRTLADVDKERVRAHCVHLPQLTEDGFVEWDRDASVVTRGPRFDEMEPLLELLNDQREGRTTPESVVVRRQ